MTSEVEVCYTHGVSSFTPNPKEEQMLSHTIVSVQPVAASQAGALPGFQARCSCGFCVTTSLSEREARQQGQAHADYMEKRGK